jgi:hypothetical protein
MIPPLMTELWASYRRYVLNPHENFIELSATGRLSLQIKFRLCKMELGAAISGWSWATRGGNGNDR